MANKVTAAIITIGDELLIGQTVDTNSAWMAQQLNASGILLSRRVAVGDNKEDIIYALNEESRFVDIILMTGGLGPTKDDITKKVLTDYFGGKLVQNEDVLAHIKSLFANRSRYMLESNFVQAMVPDNATPLMNQRGTAPGMWFEKGEKIYISMPGVPHEMKGLMTNEVIPRVEKYFERPTIIHKTLLTTGEGESLVAERLKDFLEQLPQEISWASLPGDGILKLRLTTISDKPKANQNFIDNYFGQMQELVKDICIATEDIPLERLLGNICLEKNMTIGTAESCTGGYIGHKIISISGSSAYFKGGIISYSNEMKQQLLQVPEDTLKMHGAVSKEVVEKMVAGALNALQTDYVVAVSGIMGPGGGSDEKPVGTVWIAVGNNTDIEAEQFHFRYDRERNIRLTANQALIMLIEYIEQQ